MEEVGDGFVIDGFGPDGVSARVLDITRNVVKLQTGYLYHYAFAMLIGVAGLITWFMFGVGGQSMMTTWPILSVVTFLPLIGALVIYISRGDDEAARQQLALDRAVDHVRHLRGVADPGVALRSRRSRTSSSSRRRRGWPPASPITWASTAFRCRS